MRIERDLKAGDIPGLVLLCGQEDYLTEHYADVLIRRFVEPASRQLDLVSLSGAELTAEAVETNAETLSLLSERKVIYLPGFVNRRGKLPKGFDDRGSGTGSGSGSSGGGRKASGPYAALTDYFGRIPEGVLILITAEKPITTGDYSKQSDGRKLKKLQTAVKKAGGRVYDFTALDPNQLKAFISKRFIQAGKTCSPHILRRIAQDTGYGSRYVDYDLFTLENDLRKIIAHSGDRPQVTDEDLQGTLTVNPENNVFRMLDAISQGRKDQALIHLNTLMEDGESEFGILANIVRQLEMMLIARELQDEGRPRTQAIAWLKKEERVQEFRARNVTEAAARMQTGRLKRMLLAACQVEEHIKSGLMEPRLALEYFIAEV